MFKSFKKFINSDIFNIDVSDIKSDKKELKGKGTDNDVESLIKKLFSYHGLISFDKTNLPDYVIKYINKSRLNIIDNFIKLEKNQKIQKNKDLFIYNLFGSQQYPDFVIIHIKDNILYFILFEIKSSQNDRSVWNSTLPKPFPYCIYIHINKKTKKYLIFIGKEIITLESYLKFIPLIKEIEQSVKNFNTIEENPKYNYYSRKMYNQMFNYDYKKSKKFKKNVITFLDSISNELIIEEELIIEFENECKI